MKIAIAATSSEAEAQIDRGARAPYYFLLDTESGESITLLNPAAKSEQGAGPQAAQFLISKGVSKIVAGNFGSKFRAELESGDIACIEKTGTVSKIISELSE